MSRVVTVLGDGAFGTAIALVLADNGHEVLLWSPDPAVARDIQATRRNNYYLPGLEIPTNIQPIADLNQALCQGEIIFEAIPVKYVRSVAQKAFLCDAPLKPWVCLSKGIELETGFLPTHIINEVFGSSVAQTVMVGPSFARDIANKALTGVLLASFQESMFSVVEQLITTSYFKTYRSSDVIGSQLAAALKNVIALALGILEGAGCADNTKAYVFTRGLSEMVTIVQAYDGLLETVYGLAGVGDLMLTSLGNSGRNLEVGRRLGRGQALESIINETGYTIESINTLQALPHLLNSLKTTLPVIEGLMNIVQKRQSIVDWIDALAVI